MIKNSQFDFAYDFLRLDSTWRFEWNVNEIANDTRRLYPFTEVGENKTWWFKGNKYAQIKHDQFTWNPMQPYFEYEADNELLWDATHPENITRYLTPGSSYVKLVNTVETVIIDNVPPEYVSDKGTEYIVVHYAKDQIKAERHCEYIFRDQAGLDYRNFKIKIGKGQDAIILYACTRKYDYLDNDGFRVVGYNSSALEQEQNIEDIHACPDCAGHGVNEFGRRCKTCFGEGLVGLVVNPYFDSDHIDPSSVKVSSDGFNTYKISFDLIDNPIDEEEFAQVLSESGLTIEVWDKAGNTTEYTFGINETGRFRKSWRFIDSLDDISDLLPCVVKCSNHNPDNMSVNENEEGTVWISIYNPNKEFRFLLTDGDSAQPNIEFRLTDDSVGIIDKSTIDFESRYCPVDGDPDDPRNEGIISFKVIGIKAYGNVEVEAWIKTNNKNFDDFIKTATIGSNICGPWLCIDKDGRKYDLKPYVPNYLKQSDFYEFVKLFELYLNTLYTNLTKNTNISILEKIAKIGDFNDIDRIEHCLMYHYAKHYGSEFNMDLQTMLDLNLGFYAEGALATRTEDDVLDIIRYALKNLPYYNKIKGTNNGMVMALKMFSLSCKIINLWCKMEPTIEKKADFLEEDRLYNFTSYFLTSRFNIEFNSLNVDFQSFNSSLDVFIKFIKGIKPITRILNLIKYTVIFEKNLYWTVNQFVADDSDGRGDLIYKIYWRNEKDESDPYDEGLLDEIYARTKIDWNRLHTERMWIPFNCTECKIALFDENSPGYEDQHTSDVSVFCDLNNVYTLLSELVDKSHYKFIIGYANKFQVKFKILADNFVILRRRISEDKDALPTQYAYIAGDNFAWANIPTDDEGHQTALPRTALNFTSKSKADEYRVSHNIYDEDGWDVIIDQRIVSQDAEIVKPLSFNKTLDLSDLKFEMMEHGMFIYPLNGETSTSLSEMMKPTYFVDNLLKKVPLYPGEYISDIVIKDNPYMTMWIQHIPGTEMIYCRYPELEIPEPRVDS